MVTPVPVNGPSRKRQRVETEAEQEQCVSVVRDAKYYLEDADCVIRVENTLFKVHKFLLSRDSSAFQNMFSLPSRPDDAAEGSSDMNPIILSGDTPSQFRALLFVLYALPHELQAYTSPNAHVGRLVAIVEITHKYHFASIQSWATSALLDIATNHSSRIFSNPTCLPRLVEVSLLCDEAPLHSLLLRQWREKLTAGTLPPAPAMTLADKWDIKSLRGVAYYEQALAMERSVAINDNSSPTKAKLDLDVTVTKAQRARLLSGYWSLVRLWEGLCAIPPTFTRGGSCYSHRQCTSIWRDRWRDHTSDPSTLAITSVGVLERMQNVKRLLDADEVLSTFLVPDCRVLALRAVGASIVTIQRGLSDHFVDDLTEVSV